MTKKRKHRNYNIPKDDEISYKTSSYLRKKKDHNIPICDRHIDGA